MKSFLAGFLFVVILTGLIGGLWYTKNTQKSMVGVQATLEPKVEETSALIATATEIVQKTMASATAVPTVAAVSQKQPEVNFKKTGVLVKNESGWALLYEEPGNPAVKVNLKFDSSSNCWGEGCIGANLLEGTNVSVLGNKTAGVITVVTMDN